MKVDLVMWAKNGSETLPQVLKRIDDVIPLGNVNKCIFVDDYSTDNSVEIAEKFGWKIYENKEGFVVGGVKEALKHVTTKFFVSVEQDVVLAKNWWSSIPSYMKDPRVAVACGVRKRFPPNRTLDAIEEFRSERFQRPTTLHCTLDNTIYRTSMIREIGIPTEFPLSVDLALYERVKQAGYNSVVVKNVVSYHLRKGSIEEVLHTHKHIVLTKTKRFADTTHVNLLKIFMYSPFRATQIVLEKKRPTVLIVYPLMRLMMIKTFHDRQVYLQRHALQRGKS